MTLGTAKITEAHGQVIVTYTTSTSFLTGQQIFGNSRQGYQAALRFIRERGLRYVG